MLLQIPHNARDVAQQAGHHARTQPPGVHIEPEALNLVRWHEGWDVDDTQRAAENAVDVVRAARVRDAHGDIEEDGLLAILEQFLVAVLNQRATGNAAVCTRA